MFDSIFCDTCSMSVVTVIFCFSGCHHIACLVCLNSLPYIAFVSACNLRIQRRIYQRIYQRLKSARSMLSPHSHCKISSFFDSSLIRVLLAVSWIHSNITTFACASCGFDNFFFASVVINNARVLVGWLIMMSFFRVLSSPRS